MRLPVIPIAVAVVLLGAAAALLTKSSPVTLVLDAPALSTVADINGVDGVDGVETEIAISPDGSRYAVIASGDVWLTGTSGGGATRMTATPQAESAPAWTTDGGTITVSRGGDTIAIDAATGEERVFLPDAAWLASAPGLSAFVRGRALWVAEASGTERELVAADPDQSVSIRSVRISPDQGRILYVKSFGGLRGQVWIASLAGAPPSPLVSDRVAENPTSAEWIDDGRIVYLTDRSGGLAVWYIVLEDNAMVPLTPPLMERALAPLGLDTHGERTIVPRHVIDWNVSNSSGLALADGPLPEYAPAVSARGDRIVYTVANAGVSQIWIADADGSDARYLTLGQYPRFAPNGNEVVYSRTDLDGNTDIWTADVRTGLPARLTDDAGVDDTPDWAPDGRSIVFSSERGGVRSLWTLPAGGGQRLHLGPEPGLGGYAPRFSDDGAEIAFWDRGRIWRADADGANAVEVADADSPAFADWAGDQVVFVRDGRIEGVDLPSAPGDLWGPFDRLRDGTWLVSRVRIQRTELLAIDLIFTEE